MTDKLSEKLEIVHVPVGDLKPNRYNPNRQSPHEFELLCKSMAMDGFTTPIIVRRATMEIIDGEHRWRAAKHLGHATVPVIFKDMTDEQMRIATLRRNRARGSEDAELAADVLRGIAECGDIIAAQDELMLDDAEVKKLMEGVSSSEARDLQVEVPPEMLGPKGSGLSALDAQMDIDKAADEQRAREKIVAEQRAREQAVMSAKDRTTYRLFLFFDGKEAEVVKKHLESGAGPAKNLVEWCRALVPAEEPPS